MAPVPHAVPGTTRRPALVVVNYGSSALLARNLTLSARDVPLVVVVDSWTDQAERDAVLELAGRHGWLVETPSTNTGFGTGCNTGAARAVAEGATSLVLLNPDAWIEPEALDRLVDQAEDDRSLLVAPRILDAGGAPWMSGTMDLRLHDGTVGSSRHRQPGAAVLEWVSGAVMVMSTELWTATGGFDDDYFLYWEDVDLCRRVQEAGGRVRVDTSVVAGHAEGGTQPGGGGDRAKSEAYYRYNIRNRLLYARKWLPAADRRRWTRQVPRTAWGTLLTGGRRQFLQSGRPWRGYGRGVLAAYALAAGRPVPQRPGVARATARREPGLVRVLESFAEPKSSTNPYITQLLASLRATPGTQVRCWSWGTALRGGYDVLHTHWTEALIERRGVVSTAGRRLLFALVLLRLSVTGTPVVRTVHNVDLPSGLSRTELLLLAWTERLTRARIVLNPFTPAGPASVLVEHGHYRDWFAQHPRPEPVPGRVAFIGRVRRYKNVEGLVRAFTALPPDGAPVPTLHVAGSPSTDELAAALVALAAGDPRVSLDLGYVEDADLVREVGEAELVVLPYHEMHNSGSVLAALSLDRPVLVPDTEFNRALADEVGQQWVLRFAGELDTRALAAALADVRARPRTGMPDLGRRDWAEAGARHLEAFRAARGPRAASRVTDR